MIHEIRHVCLNRCWKFPCLALLAILFAATAPGATVPEWIWHPNEGRSPGNGEVRYFRKTFDVPAKIEQARLSISADNHYVAFVNGRKVGAGDTWQSPGRVDVTEHLKAGANTLSIQASNDGGAAGLVASLEIKLADERRLVVVTDASWRTGAEKANGWEAPDFAADESWANVKTLGRLGVQPWGNVFAQASGRGGAGVKLATPAESLTTLPGFEVALVHSATGDEGSWICMTVDDKGRLIVSPQNSQQPLLRFTLDENGSMTKKETIDVGVGEAMGLLHAHDSLYANARGPQGPGLYRIKDTDGDDRLDGVEFLKAMAGGGEHGYHAIRLGPDDKLYVMNGNHTKVPEQISEQSPHRNYGEDHLLPRDWDGNGHARGIMAPGGYIARGDLDGKNWELLLAGFRNSYDFDFNGDGEIFTFDSDMEWDWGMPWYRPTVVYHAVSGADFGWRSGTGKWPWYYADTLPPAQVVGIGSPTGVLFGRGAKFPARYQKALYVMDWSYGRIVAVHLVPDDSSYRGQQEIFVSGRPLNVTDLEVGRDGAMYFTTGGRGTQSGLYRVTYRGGDSTRPVDVANEEGAEARALRRRLESYHGRQDPRALQVAWPHLNSPDRFLRHAARVAVESQPVQQWQQRALDESRIQGSLTALLALARVGPKDTQNDLLESLGRHWPESLDEAQKIDALRVAALSFVRMGRPETDVLEEVARDISPLYPAASERLNRELCRMLVYLEAPGVVEKTLNLLEKAPTQEEQLHYIVALRTLRTGWTLEQRRRYFSWFNRSREALEHPETLKQWFSDVGRGYSDGASFNKFIENFKKEAMATLSDTEHAELEPILKGVETEPVRVTMPQRAFVKEWTKADLEPFLDRVAKGRSFEKGREAFWVAQCVACHKMGNEGGAVGQELTAVSSRYTLDIILESILEPSKVLSEQYQYTTYYLKNGEDVTGKVVGEENGKLVLLVNAMTDTKMEISKADIESQVPSRLSPMPEGLVNVLTRDEILDLLAYLQGGGQKNHSAFP